MIPSPLRGGISCGEEIMNTPDIQTCENCLNAYQNGHSVSVWCVDKDFDAQFCPGLDRSVIAGETCGRWSRRRKDQPRLDFHRTMELSLF